MTVNAQDMLDRYIQAEQEVLEGRTVTMNGKTLTLESLPEIRKGREYWERRVQQQRPGGGGPSFARFL